MQTIFMWVIVIDAALVLIAGLSAATLLLLGKEMNQFWSRIAPATMMLVGTTLAAGAILAAGRWMFGG